MSRFASIFSILACLFMIAGCSGTRSFSNDHAQLVAAPDSVSAMLADAADRASRALETLAAVEQSRSPGINVAPVGNAPIELRRGVTVNWVGPVAPVTKMLAERAGYNFLIIGDPPPVPIVVSVDVENRPVVDVLRDIGLQLGVRGDIRVDSSKRTVEIHYPPNTGIGPGA